MDIVLFFITVGLTAVIFYVVKNYFLKVTVAIPLLLAAFGWGLFSGSLQGWLTLPNENVDNFLRDIEPLVEPMLKVIPLIILVSLRRITGYREGILIGVSIGLGFAFADNFIYIRDVEVLGIDQFGRMETINNIHAVSTGMMGFAMSMGRSRRTLLDKLSPVIGVLIAAIWQFAFNTLSNTVPEERLFLVSIVFMIGGTASIVTVVKTSQLSVEKRRADGLLDVVIPIGVELSSEKDFGRLLERMTIEAVDYCGADAGILYLRTDADELRFVTVRHERRGIALGGTTNKPILVDPIPLQKEDDSPNLQTAASYVAVHDRPLNLKNLHHSDTYDFSNLDMGDYRPFSCLTMPLQSSQDTTIGVLQLFDARDRDTDVIIAFEDNLKDMMESFSSLAAAALEGYLREASMRHEYAQLTINIDGGKVKEEVQQIQESDFFKDLQARARELRRDKESG